MKGIRFLSTVLTMFMLPTGAVWTGWAQDLAKEIQTEPEMVVPAGTVVPVILTAYLNTRSTQVGDRFYAETTYPVWIQQRLVVPRGSLIRGTVTEVARPGRIKGKGRLAIRFDDILLPNGVSRPLIGSLLGIHGPGDEKIDRQSESVEAGPTKGADAGAVLAPTSEGAFIGAITGGGKGAGIGAGAGALLGLATVLVSRGRDLVLEPGTQFDIELKQPLRFAHGELEFRPDQMNNVRNTTPARSRYDRDRDNRPYLPGRRGIPIPWIHPWP